MKKTSDSVVAKLLVSVIILIFFTIWTYYPATKNMFVWDTKAYLLAHEFWISKVNAYHLIWMFLSDEVHNWHPLTWLSWALDYQIYGGLDTWGFHLSNTVLHALNSALVFVLALVTFDLNRPRLTGYPFRKDNNALFAAFLAAMLFAVHPQHVESVAWVAERKDLLCQLFLLLSMLAYVRYLTCSEDLKKRWFRATLGIYCLALLSKPMAVTFPVVLLLLDAYPLRRFTFMQSVNHSIEQRTAYELLREKLPFFLLSLALILITLFAQQGALARVPYDLRVLNAFNSIIFYLTKFFLPINFSAQYPYFVDVGETITWKAFMPILGVLGITITTLFAWTKGRHVWLVAWLFYLVTLSPVLGVIQVGAQGAADRYSYFPTLPVYLLIGGGVLFLLNKASYIRKLLFFLFAAIFVFLLVDKTRQQIEVWKSDLTLWSHAINLYPNNDLAHLNIGNYYYNKQDFKKASFHFERAGTLRPNEAQTYARRALTYTFLQQYQEAINFHIKLGFALESYPELKADQLCIQYNIGWLFAKMGSFNESRELFSRVDPDSPLGPSAQIWINRLNSEKLIQDETQADENLPGFCTKLLLSR